MNRQLNEDRVGSFKKLLRYFFGLGFIFLAALGTIEYPGSKLMYLLFSTVFLLLLLSAFYRQSSYAYLFLGVFLWLGFWFKLTIHLVLDRPFVEGVGRFYGDNLAWFETNVIGPVSYSYGVELRWDEVLFVSTVAVLGIMFGRFLLSNFIHSESVVKTNYHVAPKWYPSVRKWLWLASLLTIFLIAWLNTYWGILLIGLAPKTIFPWPINTLISWLVATGSVMLVATLAWWDINLKESPTTAFMVIIVEGCLSAVSQLSRAAYLFHIIPQFLAIYKNKPYLFYPTRNFLMLISLTFFGAFLVSIISVTELRSVFYSQASTSIQPSQTHEIRIHHRLSEIPRKSWNINAIKSYEQALFEIASLEGKAVNSVEVEDRVRELRAEMVEIEKFVLDQNGRYFFIKKPYETAKYHFGNILALVADRWVGLEGVMAVSAYPFKGQEAFLEVLTEKREVGTVTIYQKICNSLYQGMDNEKYLFASLPGVVAFLYISDSLIIVFFGASLLAVIMLLGEFLTLKLTKNPLLCSLFGLTAANMIAQFGLAPLQNLPSLLMWFIATLAIFAIQSSEKTHS